jgi:hypothetical protein
MTAPLPPAEDGRMIHPRVLFLRHHGRSVWHEPHDREPWPLEYWYRADCPQCGQLFDVRALPGFSEFAVPMPLSWSDATAGFAARQQHHAAIIRRALDAGDLPA